MFLNQVGEEREGKAENVQSAQSPLLSLAGLEMEENLFGPLPNKVEKNSNNPSSHSELISVSTRIQYYQAGEKKNIYG